MWDNDRAARIRKGKGNHEQSKNKDYPNSGARSVGGWLELKQGDREIARKGFNVVAAQISLTSFSDDVAALRKVLQREKGPTVFSRFISKRRHWALNFRRFRNRPTRTPVSESEINAEHNPEIRRESHAPLHDQNVRRRVNTGTSRRPDSPSHRGNHSVCR